MREIKDKIKASQRKLKSGHPKKKNNFLPPLPPPQQQQQQKRDKILRQIFSPFFFLLSNSLT